MTQLFVFAGVIFIPNDNATPVRYLITVNKTSNVKKLKSVLLKLIEEESVDIVMAEVFDDHISRILVSNISSGSHFCCSNRLHFKMIFCFQRYDFRTD